MLFNSTRFSKIQLDLLGEYIEEYIEGDIDRLYWIYTAFTLVLSVAPVKLF